VVGVSARRADEVPIRSHDCTVSEYPTNRVYSPGDPVVFAVFPSVVVTDEGASPESLRVYAFPASRLERIGRD
jgi:hypothetical protein